MAFPRLWWQSKVSARPVARQPGGPRCWRPTCQRCWDFNRRLYRLVIYIIIYVIYIVYMGYMIYGIYVIVIYGIYIYIHPLVI